MTAFETPLLAASSEKSRLGILHLKRFWDKCMQRKAGRLAGDALQDEWNTDNLMLSALGLGLEQTMRYVYLSPDDFIAFEQWVLDANGGSLDTGKLEAFNRACEGISGKEAITVNGPLGEEEMDQWNRNGYHIIRGAVSRVDCEETIRVICEHIGIDRDDPSTWYKPHPARQGIMVQLFQHPILDKNRNTPIIRQVYEQLWGRKDIWVNADRVGFNPPETEFWKFPGPGMHFDVSLALPIPFGTQGILYLADTAENQGAFTLVPGFQNRVEAWLGSLPPGTNPRQQDMYALGAKPIAAGAGDFIIWQQALPHGSSPNTSSLPRFVQYFNYSPPDPEIREVWI
ncbi:MAG: phytanoyl-CoA dioxygenase family protein [Chitinophagaceae bacterium]